MSTPIGEEKGGKDNGKEDQEERHYACPMGWKGQLRGPWKRRRMDSARPGQRHTRGRRLVLAKILDLSKTDHEEEPGVQTDDDITAIPSSQAARSDRVNKVYQHPYVEEEVELEADTAALDESDIVYGDMANGLTRASNQQDRCQTLYPGFGDLGYHHSLVVSSIWCSIAHSCYVLR
jgi:hypothetical protein